MSVFDALIAGEKKKLLAQFSPAAAKIEAEMVKVEAAAAPFLAEVTPAEEHAALALVFPSRSAAQIDGLVSAFNLLAKLGEELAVEAAGLAKAV